MKIIQLIIYMFADISMLYFLLLILKVGLASQFNYFFLVLSVLLFLVGRFLSSDMWKSLPKAGKWAVCICVCIGFIAFAVLEGLIISGGTEHTEKEADYVVVLGCRVKGKTPSLTLQYRIDAAVEYMNAHPDCKAVLTGGQGIGEDITEAQAMYESMVKQGIAGERLLLENQSTTTKENLEFAKQYIDPEKDSIVLVSTNYHIYRAKRIAGAAGYTRVEGYGARNVWYLVPADYIREALAILKNLVLGNMG